MAPLSKFPGAASASLHMEPISIISRKDRLNTTVSIVNKPCNDYQGQQSGNTSALLLAKLSDDFNGYLRNLGDTFNDWKITLEREERSKSYDLHEYSPVSVERLSPPPYSEMSLDNSTYSSVVTPCDYVPLRISKSMDNYHSSKNSPIPHNEFLPVYNSACLVRTDKYNAGKIGEGDQTRITMTSSPDCDSNFTQCPSVRENDIRTNSCKWSPIRINVNKNLTHTRCSVKPTINPSRAFKNSKIKNQHGEPYIHLNQTSDYPRSTGIPTTLNHMTIPDKISDTHTQADLDDISAQYSKSFAKFLTILEQEDKKSLARERLLESEKEDLESWRLALKYKSKISQLTLDKLLEENNEGWAYLLNWIDEVESNSVGDSMRVHMLKLTTEKSLLRLLKLRPEQTKGSKVFTWEEVKKRLMSLISKEDIHKSTFKLLKEKMEQSNNPRVFMARIMKKYHQLCDLYDVQTLPVSLNQVIACTVTANMNLAARELYYHDLKDNAQKTTREMEKSFQDTSFRRSLFKPGTNNSQSVDPADAISFAAHGRSFNHYHEGQDDYPKVYKEFWKIRRAKCWFFQRGTCKFAMLPGGCRYEHI